MHKNEFLSISNEYFPEEIFSFLPYGESEKAKKLIKEKVFQEDFFPEDPSTLIIGEGIAEDYARSLLKFAFAFSQKAYKSTVLDSYDSASKFIKSLIKGSDAESLYIVCLDENYRIVSSEKDCTGDEGSVFVDVDKIVNRAKSVGAKSVIIAHNHESVYLRISKEDFQTTEKLFAYFKKEGIILLEHFVVCQNQVKGRIKELTGQNNWKHVSDQTVL